MTEEKKPKVVKVESVEDEPKTSEAPSDDVWKTASGDHNPEEAEAPATPLALEDREDRTGEHRPEVQTPRSKD